MSTPTPTDETTRTLVQFDLAKELTSEELAKFQESAEQAGANSLTEHFLNLTLRILPQAKPAA